MTNTTLTSLQELQKLDDRIQELEEAMAAFEPRLAEIEEPALALESELEKLETRLAQMETDARRLERAADDKRARAVRLDERLEKVQNLREEAAVSTELDLIKRAIEADEQEALQLLDQIRRSELQAQELRTGVEETRSEVEPAREALAREQDEIEEELARIRARRDELLQDVQGKERKVYEAFHEKGRSVVVSPLLDDGACGNCFSVIPLQTQNEIRTGSEMVRCEACGVILSASLEATGLGAEETEDSGDAGEDEGE